MTSKERVEKLRCLITCMKCEVSRKECDNNCPTQYDAGNMGEIIENLEEIAKALEQQPCEDCISREWLKTAIHNFYHGLRHIPTEEDIQVYIDVAPSVNPQSKADTWSIKEVAGALEKHGLIREQVSCEDCISRQMVDELSKELVHTTKDKADFLCNLWERLQKLPPVTPKIKTGQRLCRTCIYGDKTEYDKPCIIYSDNCQLYKAKILDKIRAEILEEKEHAYADFERYKVDYLGQDWEDALEGLPQDDFRYGMERCIEIIDKYKAESEVE